MRLLYSVVLLAGLVPGNSQETCGEHTQCKLVNLGSMNADAGTVVLSSTRTTTYKPIDSPVSGWSIACETTGPIDHATYLFSNGNVRKQSSAPFWIAGQHETTHRANKLPYLDECGIKTIDVKFNSRARTDDDEPCDATTIRLRADCGAPPPNRIRTQVTVSVPSSSTVKTPTRAPVRKLVSTITTMFKPTNRWSMNRPPTNRPPTNRPPTNRPPTPTNRPPVRGPVRVTADSGGTPTKPPVPAPTNPPVKPPTKAPVRRYTRAPVKPPTLAPVEPRTRTDAPVEPRPRTFPPVEPPTKTPVESPTTAPVPGPTRAPVVPPTRAPVADPTKAPVPAPTRAPVGPPTNAPVKPRTNIPNTCDVDAVINRMDAAVVLNKAIAPQWLRLAFHDAGTFNVQTSEGGANGCLLTDPSMRQQPENHSLDLALETLLFMHEVVSESIRMSSADLIQFAGFFVAVRQRGTPGLTEAKRVELKTFRWGRLDENNCQTRWTENLPGFQLGADPTIIPQRCSFAGGEIKKKMMDRNGFTAREATALIGAHTIGLTRNVFGPDLAAPWVENGADTATSQGPVFDNAYHKFLTETVTAKTDTEFALDRSPFDEDFPDWFRSNARNLNYLDTDMALAFPSQDTGVHPHFDRFSKEFAASDAVFINSFMAALDKMSKLGVRVTLQSPSSCGPVASPAATPAALPPPGFTSGLRESIGEAREQLADTLEERDEEIEELTTPVENAGL